MSMKPDPDSIGDVFDFLSSAWSLRPYFTKDPFAGPSLPFKHDYVRLSSARVVPALTFYDVFMSECLEWFPFDFIGFPKDGQDKYTDAQPHRYYCTIRTFTDFFAKASALPVIVGATGHNVPLTSAEEGTLREIPPAHRTEGFLTALHDLAKKEDGYIAVCLERIRSLVSRSPGREVSIYEAFQRSISGSDSGPLPEFMANLQEAGLLTVSKTRKHFLPRVNFATVPPRQFYWAWHQGAVGIRAAIEEQSLTQGPLLSAFPVSILHESISEKDIAEIAEFDDQRLYALCDAVLALPCPVYTVILSRFSLASETARLRVRRILCDYLDSLAF